MVRKIMLMKLTDNGVKDIMNAPRQIEEAFQLLVIWVVRCFVSIR